ncbi:unnamed protein product [[Candida] boidinii]|nr:unnamed protein product [[Candida] boidinii]
MTQYISSYSTLSYAQTLKTSDMNTVIESLPQMTESLSLLPPVVTATDVTTIRKTVDCSTISDSASFLTLESLVVIKSTRYSISVSTASAPVLEISVSSVRTGRVLESQGEYVTLTSVLSIQPDIPLTAPYEAHTEAASVFEATKPNVLLSLSYSSGETTEITAEYTDGSASRQSNIIFKYLSAVIFVILII